MFGQKGLFRVKRPTTRFQSAGPKWRTEQQLKDATHSKPAFCCLSTQNLGQTSLRVVCSHHPNPVHQNTNTKHVGRPAPCLLVSLPTEKNSLVDFISFSYKFNAQISLVAFLIREDFIISWFCSHAWKFRTCALVSFCCCRAHFTSRILSTRSYDLKGVNLSLSEVFFQIKSRVSFNKILYHFVTCSEV